MEVPVSEGGFANVNDPQIIRIRRTSTSRRGGFRSQSNLPRKIAGGWEQQGTTTRCVSNVVALVFVGLRRGGVVRGKRYIFLEVVTHGRKDT